MALNGVDFANYFIGMGEKGRDRSFELSERERARMERERLLAMQEAARERNAKVFGGYFGPMQTPQGAAPVASPPAPMPQRPQQAPSQGKGRFAPLFQQAAQKYGLPSGYLDRTAQIESGMNPGARNPRSTAKGLFQFLDRTAQQYGLADPMNPEQATDAAARYAQNSMKALRGALGRDPTPGELYLAHQQGVGGAIRILRNPNAPAMQIVGRRALMLNGGNPNMTAAQFAQKWIGKFDRAPAQGAPTQLASSGPMPAMGREASPQMQQQAQQPQPPGSEIPTQDLIAVMRDPGSSEEDRAIAKMFLQSRFSGQREQQQLGMTPIWGRDAQGRPVLLQLGQGQLVQAQTPQGVDLTPGVGMLNTGTSFMPYDQKTGTPVGSPIPIDVAGKASQEVTAKDAAERATQAPGAIRKAQEAITVIDGILEDPSFRWGTGALGVLTRNIPGTNTYGFGKRVAQLQGQAFLQAFESLKGGGAITQVEGEKATNAIARLDAAQSPEDLQAALSELRGIFETAIQREQARLSGQRPGPVAPPASGGAADPLGLR